MSNDKARISIKVGETVVEIEGSEKYVEGKLKDPHSIDGLLSKVGVNKVGKSAIPKRGKKTTTKRKGKRKETYQIVKNLDLAGGKSKISLKAFYKEKNPSKYFEKNAVFAYYLKKIAKIQNINRNHIYTCYKDVKSKGPENLNQSLLDTAHHKGWIDTSNMDDMQVSIRGENFVEHDLPKPERSD